MTVPIPTQEGSNKYHFKARILDPNGPHEKFLDDPCDNTIASFQAYTRFMTSLHTTVFADEDTGCGVGDIITILLEMINLNGLMEQNHIKM